MESAAVVEKLILPPSTPRVFSPQRREDIDVEDVGIPFGRKIATTPIHVAAILGDPPGRVDTDRRSPLPGWEFAERAT